MKYIPKPYPPIKYQLPTIKHEIVDKLNYNNDCNINIVDIPNGATHISIRTYEGDYDNKVIDLEYYKEVALEGKELERVTSENQKREKAYEKLMKKYEEDLADYEQKVKEAKEEHDKAEFKRLKEKYE